MVRRKIAEVWVLVALTEEWAHTWSDKIKICCFYSNANSEVGFDPALVPPGLSTFH